MTDEAKALVERLRNTICHGDMGCERLIADDEAADLIETQAREIERLREELAAAYVHQSGTNQHASDCATSNAPAMKPGPCDCAALGEKQ